MAQHIEKRTSVMGWIHGVSELPCSQREHFTGRGKTGLNEIPTNSGRRYQSSFIREWLLLMVDGPKPTPTITLDHTKKPPLKGSLWSSQSPDLNIFRNLQTDLRRAVMAQNSPRTEDYIEE